LPTRSTIAQRSSRRCKLSSVSSASSRRRKPHPTALPPICAVRLRVELVEELALQETPDLRFPSPRCWAGMYSYRAHRVTVFSSGRRYYAASLASIGRE
jgi:hypothetical protein